MQLIIKNSKGMTLVELMIALGLFSILIMAMMQPMVMSTTFFKKSMDIHDRNQSLIILDKLIDKHFSNVSPLRFNPVTSMYLDASDNLNFVGATWNLNGLVFPSADYSIKNFTVAPLPAMPQDSFNIEMYIIRRDVSSVAKETLGLITSRCVDFQTYTKPTTAAQVLTLQNVVIEKSGFKCCSPGSLSSCSAINPTNLWPTVFMIKDNNQIATLPETQDRELTPGLGINIIFTSITPKSYLVRSIRMRNRCKTTMIQYQRPCASTKEGTTDLSNFTEDITYEVKEISRPAISDVTDSSFIGIGNEIL
jgi:prepilin-type N-terminal cleavage/methylation domain-containing protein